MFRLVTLQKRLFSCFFVRQKDLWLSGGRKKRENDGPEGPPAWTPFVFIRVHSWFKASLLSSYSFFLI